MLHTFPQRKHYANAAEFTRIQVKHWSFFMTSLPLLLPGTFDFKWRVTGLCPKGRLLSSISSIG